MIWQHLLLPVLSQFSLIPLKVQSPPTPLPRTEREDVKVLRPLSLYGHTPITISPTVLQTICSLLCPLQLRGGRCHLQLPVRQAVPSNWHVRYQVDRTLVAATAASLSKHEQWGLMEKVKNNNNNTFIYTVTMMSISQ